MPVSASHRAASPRSRRALAGTTASAGRAEAVAAAGLHLAEGEHLAVPGDDVDLALGAAPVAGDRPQPGLDQVPDGAPLAVRADAPGSASSCRPRWARGRSVDRPSGPPVDNRRAVDNRTIKSRTVLGRGRDGHRECIAATTGSVRGADLGRRPSPAGWRGGAGRIPCPSWTDDGAFLKIRSRAGTRRPTRYGESDWRGAGRAALPRRRVRTPSSGGRGRRPVRRPGRPRPVRRRRPIRCDRPARADETTRTAPTATGRAAADAGDGTGTGSAEPPAEPRRPARPAREMARASWRSPAAGRSVRPGRTGSGAAPSGHRTGRTTRPRRSGRRTAGLEPTPRRAVGRRPAGAATARRRPAATPRPTPLGRRGAAARRRAGRAASRADGVARAAEHPLEMPTGPMPGRPGRRRPARTRRRWTGRRRRLPDPPAGAGGALRGCWCWSSRFPRCGCCCTA